MADLKDDVLTALGKIVGPEGAPLPATGKLSEILQPSTAILLP